MFRKPSPDSGSASQEDGSDMSEDETYSDVVEIHHGNAMWLNASLLECLQLPHANKNNPVYQLLSDQLKKVKIVYPVENLDYVRSIRMQYSVEFTELVNYVQMMINTKMIGQSEVSITLSADIQERVDTLLRPRNFATKLMVPSLQGSVPLNMSRYNDDFAQNHFLGEGCYGKVFDAKNMLDKCDYAIKKIYICDTDTAKWIQILREVEILVKLSHKHIVRYHTVWLEHNNPYTASTGPSSEIFKATIGSARIGGTDFDPQVVVGQQEGETINPKSPNLGSNRGDSCGSSLSLPERTIMEDANVILHIQMELCKTTLLNWLQKRDSRQTHSGEDVYSVVKENDTRMIMRQVLDGVNYIHDQNIIHRDLKPDNIFLMAGDDIHVKIGDFGVSRFDTLNMPNASHQETTPGGGDRYTSGLGDILYVAPEQHQGSNYNIKVDMFSVGLIMFELYQPFSGVKDKEDSFTSVICKQLLPETFRERWPQQAKYIKKLVGAVAEERPTAAQILQEELFCSKDQIIANLRCKVTSQDEQIKLLQARISQLEQRLSEKEKQQSSQETTNTSA